jgi:putative PIN family toxin of toxin-antitoxin system
MNYVLDANVLVAAVRSPAGASAEILRRVLLGQVGALCSVPLFMEYEAVLLRQEHLAAAGAHSDQVINLLNALAGAVIRVEIQFLWRPQLRDPNDDLVLELAVNGQGVGDSVAIVTSNQKDFWPQASKFGIGVMTPRHFFQGA